VRKSISNSDFNDWQYKVMAELLPGIEKLLCSAGYKGIEIFRAVSIFNKEH
jgi:hypothetical protein